MTTTRRGEQHAGWIRSPILPRESGCRTGDPHVAALDNVATHGNKRPSQRPEQQASGYG